MRKLVVILTLLALLGIPLAVHAQGTVSLSSVSVDLWPEYDQPAVLTIYHLQLPQNTKFPAPITLRVPASAQINAVAVVDPAKGLVNAAYQSALQGDWNTLNITATTAQVQVEYYVALEKNGAERQIVYEWPADQAVTTLEVNFLQPPASEQVKMTPAPTSSGPGQGGLTNYLVKTANPPVGQPFRVTIEYQRQTDELGIASLPVQAISTPGVSTPGNTSGTPILPWALGGLGVLLLAGGAYGLFGMKRGAPGARKAHAKAIPAEAEDEVVYCSECGKRAQPGDIFCRTCGARLRTDET